ncbi:MAG: hypothetical protein KIT84_36515 [Labilithrix sp.]|nr:hypothetical protein [Labilithrix sp.]MCW5816560.1 hypothetical protein [Labilithrix sp.]
MTELDPIGRAKRETHGEGAELWRLPASDAGVARRLVAFGEAGVGGFAPGASELELVRRLPTTTVQSLARGERLDGITALAKVRDVARALAHCESKGVFPGALRPSEVALGSAGRAEAFILAESWVRALVGGGHVAAASSSGPSARWTPPEQANGAPWDNAANRWVLGLVAYRLIAGAHPFSGAGLRDALAAEHVPPFADDVAKTLRPGIQSFILTILAADPSKRPPNAAAIADRCEDLIRDEPARARSPRDGRSAREGAWASSGSRRDGASASGGSVRAGADAGGSARAAHSGREDASVSGGLGREGTSVSGGSSREGRAGADGSVRAGASASGRDARTSGASGSGRDARAGVSVAGSRREGGAVARSSNVARDDEAAAARRAERIERIVAASGGGGSVAATPVAAPLRPKRWVAFVPIALGLAIAGASVAASRSNGVPAPVESPRRAIAQAPLTKTTAEQCGQCHAREVGEWQGSVMAHAVKSPLFGALESAVEEQVGKDDRCPGGAGVLRKAGADVCRDERTGVAFTGAGGEHWCVNCHSASDNLRSTVPPWSAFASNAQKPLRDVLTPQAMEGISCAVCHQTIGPVHGTTAYEGNPTWTSPFTGRSFLMRPEDGVGVRGIANSGYLLDSSIFLTPSLGRGGPGDPVVHKRVPEDTARYVRSSEFCGACHDVRLFGTDSFAVRDRGEHFKRLRNAYSEWKTWSDTEKSAGRRAATCQDCHMSLFPGVCVQSAGSRGAGGCPPGTKFEARAPGERARGLVATSSSELKPVASHWFTSVDLPLSPEYPDSWANDRALDGSGVPVGLEARRRQLLEHTFKLTLAKGTRFGSRLEVPVELQNVGAGHRVPAGFSQEREIWIEMTVKDGRGDVVYEVGKLTSDDADLQDKTFTRITTRDDNRDFRGRPLGVFGADVVDGRDVPLWEPNPAFGGTSFRGKGLINLQNGFLRCVKCIGFIDREGRCQAGPGQGRTRADRFDDGAYDLDTGECRSNLTGNNAFFETFFPVGSLDADRGFVKAPDAILDQRSAAPGVVVRYTYELETGGRQGPFTVTARLRFRPFPPFLLRAFADYEANKAREGRRPSGPQVTPSMFRRNHPIDLAETQATIP